MTSDTPVACSLSASDLEKRLAEIAKVGAEGLIAQEARGDSHRLRFRKDEDIGKRLQGIVAAEAECCAFLDLSLDDEDGELILWIAAPREAAALAGGLTDAFGDGRAGGESHDVVLDGFRPGVKSRQAGAS